MKRALVLTVAAVAGSLLGYTVGHGVGMRAQREWSRMTVCPCAATAEQLDAMVRVAMARP